MRLRATQPRLISVLLPLFQIVFPLNANHLHYIKQFLASHSLWPLYIDNSLFIHRIHLCIAH